VLGCRAASVTTICVRLVANVLCGGTASVTSICVGLVANVLGCRTPIWPVAIRDVSNILAGCLRISAKCACSQKHSKDSDFHFFSHLKIK
jgi:hypothetical protein